MNTIERLPASILLVAAFIISPIFFLTKPAISQNKNPIQGNVVSYFASKNVILTTRLKKLPTVNESVGEVTISYNYTSVPQRQNTFNSNFNKYSNIIRSAASQYNVSYNLMNSIIACESGYNPLAYNPSGASGIAQFMPSTFYGSWNIYRSGGLWDATSQIYAMALKISQGGVNAWTCK